MGFLKFSLRWGWLLGLALLVPISLPAGGGEPNKTEIRNSTSASHYLAAKTLALRAAPSCAAPSLGTLKMGTPMTLLRVWRTQDGTAWFQVKAFSMKDIGRASRISRGWISV